MAGSAADGISPVMTWATLARAVSGSASGTALSKPRVYGWAGRLKTSAVGPISTSLPRYMMPTRSAT